MTNIRDVVLSNGETYHVFNRGVERRTIFTNFFDYRRAMDIMNYYRFADLPLRYSHLLQLNVQAQTEVLNSLIKWEVSIFAYCLMPNHYHFILRQENENGISRFISNFSNSYCKFFNIKNDREGPLFQGYFKAVHVETDDQLLHLSRYIHLNPTVSHLIPEEKVDSYPWSSLREYLDPEERLIVDPEIVLGQFKDTEAYRKFVHDRTSYARELEKIKHLALEEV